MALLTKHVNRQVVRLSARCSRHGRLLGYFPLVAILSSLNWKDSVRKSLVGDIERHVFSLCYVDITLRVDGSLHVKCGAGEVGQL